MSETETTQQYFEEQQDFIDQLLKENTKLKSELQRTRDLLGSWINKATKALKDLEKMK